MFTFFRRFWRPILDITDVRHTSGFTVGPFALQWTNLITAPFAMNPDADPAGLVAATYPGYTAQFIGQNVLSKKGKGGVWTAYHAPHYYKGPTSGPAVSVYGWVLGFASAGGLQFMGADMWPAPRVLNDVDDWIALKVIMRLGEGGLIVEGRIL